VYFSATGANAGGPMFAAANINFHALLHAQHCMSELFSKVELGQPGDITFI
jgi:hypothetical protein